jgi:monofunctional biosynthetic peptidoglycan transglycosylase
MGPDLVDEPTVEIDPDMKRKRKRRARGRAAAWLRRILLVAFVIALLPLALTFAYLPHAVHPISTLMLKDLVTFTGYERRWTPLEEIGDRLKHSVMMSEDGQFCAHKGIDIAEFRALFEEFMAGEQTRGGSTITMQTVKNLFLWQGRSYIRKAIELPLSVYFDFFVPKDRIMEIYLNIAEWGPNLYGAETASLHYFGKPSSELTSREAALLAVTLPNPYERDPANPGPGLSRIAGTIQARADRAGDYVGCLE